jgi:hypothetical protein
LKVVEKEDEIIEMEGFGVEEVLADMLGYEDLPPASPNRQERLENFS